jgi:hydrogenase maturation protease
MSNQGGTLVLGVGNPLMTDDGLGLAALEALQRGWAFEPSVELVDGGTWGMRLLPAIEDAGRLLILDAIDKGAAPGTLVELDRSELPLLFTTKVSPHQVDLREVLALAALRGTLPPVLAAVGLQPDRIAMGTELSPRLARGLDDLVRRAAWRLESWGHVARAVELEPAHA